MQQSLPFDEVISVQSLSLLSKSEKQLAKETYIYIYIAEYMIRCAYKKKCQPPERNIFCFSRDVSWQESHISHLGKQHAETSQQNGRKRLSAETTLEAHMISVALSSASVLQSHANTMMFSLPLHNRKRKITSIRMTAINFVIR